MPEIPYATVPTRLERFAHEVSTAYASTDWPEAELYSITADALRLIASLAKTNTDLSCVELNQDELEAEGRKKFIELVAVKGILKRLPTRDKSVVGPPTRVELFKFLKSAVNNHMKGLVHRYRFTAKRTGCWVPPKFVKDAKGKHVLDEKGKKIPNPELKDWDSRWQKPEVSLDASPEVRAAVEFRATDECGQTSIRGSVELDDDMAETLTPLEFLVYEQLTSPNAASLEYATQDARRQPSATRHGTPRSQDSTGAKLDIKLRYEHHALGLGLPLTTFMHVIDAITEKHKAYLSGQWTADSARPLLPVMTAPERETLTPVEFLVYHQLAHPDQTAHGLAKARRTPLTTSHIAEGAGFSLVEFLRIVDQIKAKHETYMSQTTELTQTNAAVTALEKIFSVQVPRALPAVVVRRLFTIAARSRYELVTPDVVSLLESIGAVAPTLNAHGKLTCYGILFAENHATCSACKARVACRATAHNHGLDGIAISLKLLSERAQVRTAEADEPGVQPVSEEPTPRGELPATSEREEEIRQYLEQNFKLAPFCDKNYYVHKTKRPDGRVKHIVSISANHTINDSRLNPSFLLHFCKANQRPELEKELIKIGQGFFAPDSMPVDRVTALIEAHADYLFKVKHG